jgi:broad specificity phosphatase PhoE
VSVHSATVYYVRHGESLVNLARELSHRDVDKPLTEHGADQARRLALFLADSPGIKRPVYSSPLLRARQTAEIVADRLGTSVEVVEGFREFDVGDLDGRTDAEAWATYDSVLWAWSSGERDVAFPGGENHVQLVDRVRRGLSHVVRGRDHEPVVVVAHGGILRAALPALLPGARRPEFDMDNCAITELALRLSGESGESLSGSLVCWSQQPELAALRPGTGRRRAVAHH